MSRKRAVVIGNSDGIGLGLTKRLAEEGWQQVGISRSESSYQNDNYSHMVADVTSATYLDSLGAVLDPLPDLVVYCAGIGEEFDHTKLSFERKVFEVNLMGAVKTIEAVLPGMIAAKRGHIVILSSIADALTSAESPSYCASKAALTSYVEGLARGVRKQGVSITNVRFGFVDTKMAKGDKQPLKMSVDRSVEHLMYCIDKKPIRFSRPRIMAALVVLARWLS